MGSRAGMRRRELGGQCQLGAPVVPGQEVEHGNGRSPGQSSAQSTVLQVCVCGTKHTQLHGATAAGQLHREGHMQKELEGRMVAGRDNMAGQRHPRNQIDNLSTEGLGWPHSLCRQKPMQAEQQAP